MSGGRVLVGGMVGHRLAMVRLLPNGSPDPRFASGGWSLSATGGVAKSLTLSRVGSRIYLAGVVRSGDRLRVVLLRFGGDGRLDTSFGHRGRRSVSIPSARVPEPKAIVPTPSGILVVLSRGTKPLLLFARDGRVRRQSVGNGSRDSVGNVRAAVSGGRLILGWQEFSPAVRRDVYLLGRSTLP